MLIKRLFPFVVIFFVVQSILRISLLIRGLIDIEFSKLDILLALTKGFWFDLVTCAYFLIPVMLYYLFLSHSAAGKKLDKTIDSIMRFVFTYILLFDFVAEHLFWTEFTTRFNFIAVDYLVYTQEVIGNIIESYPIIWLLVGIAFFALLISFLSIKLQPFSNFNNLYSFKPRLAQFAAFILLCFVLHKVSNIDQTNIPNNVEATEIAANGVYNLFHAFWHNEIHYDRFYKMEPNEEVNKETHNLLLEDDRNEYFVNNNANDFTRAIYAKGKELHKNVILVVMESLSADYMQAFGNEGNLTPNLDKLSQEGLFFTNLYATGTRTVRGLEAVTLSIPPTPGQSIIRRPGNDNLFSLGFIFKDRGYDTKFIYGGYGYFDNMNAFFSGNGFDIIDRNNMSKQEVSFANVWGVCDEDMFMRAIKEADKSYAQNKPFMHLIMTTSNHRPYTYPNGKIDVKSHTGRNGGVKYADYSIGRLIEEAKQKPWFKDTIFVFVADHTAGAGGKAELDPNKYHIPMIFYAPKFIKKQQFTNISSQIDLAPILLGLLNFSYYTKFYGEDLLEDKDEIPHAFISNYQKVALVKNGGLTVLSPKRKVAQYTWPNIQEETEISQQLIKDTISYYQSASWWREQYKRIPTILNKEKVALLQK